MAEAMKYAAPLAGVLGQSVEGVGAAVGVLGNAGIQGSMAGTQLRMMFAKLLKPTDEAKKAIEENRINIEDLNPAMHSLQEIVHTLADANLSAADTMRIFDVRATNAVLTLTKNVKKFDELEEANQKAAGTAKAFADLLNTTLIGSFKSLVSAIQEAMLQVGDAGFLGVLKDTIEFATELVRHFAGIEAGTTRFGTRVETAAKYLKGFASAVSVLMTFKLATWLVHATAAMKAFTVASLANPFVMVATAASLAVGALIIYQDEMIRVGSTSIRVGAQVEGVWKFLGIAFRDKMTWWGEQAEAAVKTTESASSKLFNFLGIGMTGKEIDELRRLQGLDLSQPKEKARNRPEPGVLENIAISQNLEAEDILKRTKFLDIKKAAEMERRAVLQSLEKLPTLTVPELDFKEPKVKDELTDLEQMANNIGEAFSNTFLDIATGAATAEDAIRSLGQQVLRMILEQTVGQQISKTVSIAVNYATNAVTTMLGGGVKPGAATPPGAATAGPANLPPLQMAEGGLVTSPTMALIGEAGPEMVVPLGSKFGSRRGGVGLKRYGMGGIFSDPFQASGMDSALGVPGLSEVIGMFSDDGKPKGRFGTGFSFIDLLKGGPLHDAYLGIRNYVARTLQGGGLFSGAGPAANLGAIWQELTSIGGVGFDTIFQNIAGLSPGAGIRSLFSFAGGATSDLLGAGLNTMIGNLQQSSNPLIAATATVGGQAFSDIMNPTMNLGKDPFAGKQGFARGGLVTTPTLFQSGQGLGLMGESGPEAILPLIRGGDGRLGVGSSGGGGGVVVVNMNIKTPDADSFRKSRKQLVEGMKNAVRR